MGWRLNRKLGCLILLLLGGCATSQPSVETQTEEQAPDVITLTQTGCQFVETEGKDYQFTTTAADDCKKLNRETLGERESGFQPLTLAPGSYTFRVTNRDVPYELGFYLRGKGANQFTLPKVSGGGLTTGKTQDYEVTLKPGEYLFSCPLNPTPDYPLVVR